MDEAIYKWFIRRVLICSVWVFCGMHLFCMQLRAQADAAPRSVSESEALNHMQRRVDPIYPPIAAAARVEGEVRISVLIDAQGRISSEKVLSGPLMLQGASLDAVKKWQFSFFTVNGTPEPVTTVVTIPFRLYGQLLSGKQEKAVEAWFPVFDKCRTALKAGNEVDSLNYCEQALEVSLQAGDLTGRDQLARLNSHQLYTQALMMSGNAQGALEQENLAIKEARKCFTNQDEGYAKLYYWRGAAEAKLGNGDAATADYQNAEAICRLAIANLPQSKEIYSPDLAAILKAHANLLDSMGKTAEAEKLRAEAAAL
jgi:TonB family protein